jgi:hypothetical protein
VVWAGAAFLLPDLLKDLLVVDRLAHAFDADAEHAVLCFGTVFHRAAGNTAAALLLDAEREEKRLFGSVK